MTLFLLAIGFVACWYMMVAGWAYGERNNDPRASEVMSFLALMGMIICASVFFSTLAVEL